MHLRCPWAWSRQPARKGDDVAHELHIDTKTGRASMVYVGEEPWHGLGAELSEPATAAEAIAAANLGWRVVKKPLWAADGGRRKMLCPGTYAVVREDLWGKDECRPLGIVSEGYTPLQNSDAFAFFDPIVGEKAAVYHTAGALGDGERVWALAKLPESIRVVGDDVCDKFLLLSNSHDGKSSVQVKFTPIRVVCNNTLTMALSRGPTVRVAHTRNLHERLRHAERLLGIVRERFRGIEEDFRAMAGVQVSSDVLGAYLRQVFPDPEDVSDPRELDRAERDRAWSERFFAEGEGNREQGVAGTLWAAYNGVTEYVDHRAAVGVSPGRRLSSVWFGTGYHRKAKAFTVAKELLETLAN